MAPADNENKTVHALEKKIRLLERKLNQDNLSRMLIEEAHDRYQNIYKHVLLELTKQKEELETAQNILHEKGIELESANLQLKIAKEKAELSDRFKSEFLANMSHEIRTPMNAVVGYLSLLEKTRLDNVQADYIEQIKTASEMLLYLVNDILDLSKIESGKMIFDEKNFDLRKLITESASQNVPKAREKGIYLKINYDDTIPGILTGDPMRIMQVLNNLVTNAVKFTKEGGVTIKADHTGNLGKRDKIFISVSDTGPGIDEDEKDILFEPFIQSRMNSYESSGGTGLGLAICKKILNHMGSDIYLVSEPGKGSKFYFELVLDRGLDKLREQKTGTSDPDEFKITRNISILIVEDNNLCLTMFSKIMSSLGLTADTALNGSDAITKSMNKVYNLIFMDNILPEKNGYEATMEIRKSGKSKNAVIIGLTAGVLKEEKDRLFSSGMNDILFKPVKIGEVKEIISKYFSYRF